MWFCVTILLPVLGPLFFAGVRHFLDEKPGSAPGLLIREGQLGWSAMALAGAGIYELGQCVSNGFTKFLYGGFWVIMIVSIICSVVGFGIKNPKYKGTWTRASVTTSALTAAAVILLCVVHFAGDFHDRWNSFPIQPIPTCPPLQTP